MIYLTSSKVAVVAVMKQLKDVEFCLPNAQCPVDFPGLRKGEGKKVMTLLPSE